MSHMYNVLLPAPFPNLLFQPIKVFAMAARAIPIQFYNSSDPLISAEFSWLTAAQEKNQHSQSRSFSPIPRVFLVWSPYVQVSTRLFRKFYSQNCRAQMGGGVEITHTIFNRCFSGSCRRCEAHLQELRWQYTWLGLEAPEQHCFWLAFPWEGDWGKERRANIGQLRWWKKIQYTETESGELLLSWESMGTRTQEKGKGKAFQLVTRLGEHRRAVRQDIISLQLIPPALREAGLVNKEICTKDTWVQDKCHLSRYAQICFSYGTKCKTWRMPTYLDYQVQQDANSWKHWYVEHTHRDELTSLRSSERSFARHQEDLK